MKKMFALVLALTLIWSAPAFSETDTDREAAAAAHTILVTAPPVLLAAGVLGGAESPFVEMWFVPYGIIVGNYIEWKYDPERMGRGYRWNGHAHDGSENKKWEDHPGTRWKWLKAYPDKGPGVQPEPVSWQHKFDVKSSGSAIDRVGA